MKTYLTGANDIATIFSEIAEQIHAGGCNLLGAKISIKQKMNKVLSFGRDVLGPEELAGLTKPYFETMDNSLA